MHSEIRWWIQKICFDKPMSWVSSKCMHLCLSFLCVQLCTNSPATPAHQLHQHTNHTMIHQQHQKVHRFTSRSCSCWWAPAQRRGGAGGASDTPPMRCSLLSGTNRTTDSLRHPQLAHLITNITQPNHTKHIPT